MSVRPKKRLGQHFLTDHDTVRRIVDAVAAPPGAPVVEIGPGEGALTGVLLERYPALVALEVDPEAVAHLRARHPALDVRQGDVLEVDWGALAGQEGGGKGQGGKDDRRGGADAPATPPEQTPHPVPLPEGEGTSSGGGAAGKGGVAAPNAEPPSHPPPAGGRRRNDAAPPNPAALGEGGVVCPPPHSPIPHPPPPIPAPKALHVVGNLPYYITSPILFALLDGRAHVARAVVMVQKEVADRLAAPPGSKTYGTLSVYFALYAETRTLFTVSRHCFRPKPAVESAVVAVDFGAAPDPGVAFGPLQRVVRAAFGQRRKMLRNSLGPLAEAAGVPVPDWAATLRPEAVSPADFVRLARHFDAAP